MSKIRISQKLIENRGFLFCLFSTKPLGNERIFKHTLPVLLEPCSNRPISYFQYEPQWRHAETAN